MIENGRQIKMSSPLNEQDLPTLAELDALLEDKSFVDHFNVCLSLPIWGQQVIYSFADKEFEFDPPIRRRRFYVHRRAVLEWLRQERLPYFRQTRLFVEYLLCTRIRDVGFHVRNSLGKDMAEPPEPTRVFTSNLLSHVVGMQLFRDSLRGTPGERAFNCWIDVEIFRQSKNPKLRRRQFQHIKAEYLVDGGPFQLAGKIKTLFHYGKLNFEIVSNNIRELIESLSTLSYADDFFTTDSENTLSALQGLLLEALQRYWVPRHVMHVLHIHPVELLRPLFRSVDGEDMDMDTVMRMIRYRRLFPQIIVDLPDEFVSSTEVYQSNTEKDDPRRTIESPVTVPEIKPDDLLSLWGGGPFKPITTEMIMPRPWSAVSWAFNDDSIATETPVSPGELESPSPTDDSELRTPSGSSIINMLKLNSSMEFNDESLSRMVLSNIKKKKHGKMSQLLKNFVFGRRDFKVKDPRISNRIMCALASDELAGWPFMHFLKQKQLTWDMNYLNFWLDVRAYLRTDDFKFDRNGVSCKKIIAKNIAERYLMSANDGESIFSESLKMALLESLSRDDDESLLYATHDIVSSALSLTWKKFVAADRRRFARASCGKRLLMYITSLDSPLANGPHTPEDGKTKPVYFQRARQRIGSAVDSECSSCSSPSPRIVGRNNNMKLLGDEHRTAALQYSVMLSEDVSLIQPLYEMFDLVKSVSSSYGSLDLNPGPVVSQDELRRLMFPEKIDIATIKVSREVIIPEINISNLEKLQDMPECRGGRLVLRRNGVILTLPNKPRSFLEVLNDPAHIEFFKRFLLARKVTTPLQFWKAVEDLKETHNSKARHMKTKHIFRRFFGKQAKYGASLECNDEVIRQIPFMESITPGMMVCAQASVYRMMERKWYPGYLDTFPSEVDIRDVTHDISSFNMPDIEDREDLNKEWLPRRKQQRRKTLHLWHVFISLVIDFLRSLKKPCEAQLFEIYLKRELERMTPSERLMETKEIGRGRDSITFDTTQSTMTRVVVRNKVVVVNKLPRDIQFWLEVERYKEQVDGVRKSGNATQADYDLLIEKARAITACFLASDIPPRVQVNIPTDLSVSINNSLNVCGPSRGLFHEACVLVFPVLYHFWKRFKAEWIDTGQTEAMLDRMRMYSGMHSGENPHFSQILPDFLNPSLKDIKTFFVPGAEEDLVRINFTLMNGIRILLPKPKGTMKGEKHDEDDETIDGLSLSPQRPRISTKSSMTSVASRRSTRTVHTATSKRLSDLKDGRSSTTTGSPLKNGRRKSSLKYDVTLNPADITKNKARRLSAMVENLNAEIPPGPHVGGRKISQVINVKPMNAVSTTQAYED